MKCASNHGVHLAVGGLFVGFGQRPPVILWWPRRLAPHPAVMVLKLDRDPLLVSADVLPAGVDDCPLVHRATSSVSYLA
eukprot:2844756-Amphidinium_carterae.1